jgi:hypothetical protein
MEENPDLEFEHFLGAKLSMTVAELRERISNQEFVRWGVYYGRKAQQQQLAGGGG